MNGVPTVSEERLQEVLPHGSGIDADWVIETCKNGTVVAHNSFHNMNDNGMYCGWTDFKVRVFRCTKDKIVPLFGPCDGQSQVVYRKGDIHMQVVCSNRGVLRDYLWEMIDCCLSDAEITTQLRHERIPTTFDLKMPG